ncbi:glycosyltransferase [Fictibacillus nanhaiensis]|uniref:glycosyltransferase family 2 protein n=1 Tax=Fictibacillus nanhaiensis TaxID=742169 RepID=UPI001C94328C|nr:glycosyltransferase [Fictibacillus nanhaiensis]MBY6037580.1 glycosyltransferase [Fictibacillus nanhaiensis]
MLPKVSIVLSTYNAIERLKKCLFSITLQTYTLSDLEVVVIDDCSTDQTQEYIENTIFPFSVIYHKNDKNSGRSYTRNKGIHHSNGEVLIFCDCDMILPPEFVQKHLNYHKANNNLVVCGSFWQQLPLSTSLSLESIKSRAYQNEAIEQPWAYWFKQFVQLYGKHLSSFYFPWMYFVVMNVSVRKEHIIQAGCFDESFQGYGGEDEELGYRLYQNGLPFIMDTNIKNFHQEHERSFNQQKESQSNINYIVKKHPNIDILLFYCFKEFDHFFKNNICKEIDELNENSVLHNLEKMIARLEHQGSLDEMEDFYYFSRKSACPPHLSRMIKKKLKQGRRF